MRLNNARANVQPALKIELQLPNFNLDVGRLYSHCPETAPRKLHNLLTTLEPNCDHEHVWILLNGGRVFRGRFRQGRATHAAE